MPWKFHKQSSMGRGRREKKWPVRDLDVGPAWRTKGYLGCLRTHSEGTSRLNVEGQIGTDCTISKWNEKKLSRRN